MWKKDPMSGFDIRLVFTLPPRDSTLQYKRCVHFWNNFPCITSLLRPIYRIYVYALWDKFYINFFLIQNLNQNKHKSIHNSLIFSETT